MASRPAPTSPIDDAAPSAEIARGQPLSWREKIGLGSGRMAVDGSHLTFYTLVNPVYNVLLGLNPAVLSFVLVGQRIWDGMIDPLAGQFSDNFRSSWGRRIPLLATASIPLAVMFTAIWWFPREWGHQALLGYLLITSLGFYAAHSLYTMPLLALVVEATDDYRERTRLAGLVQGFGFAFQILTQWLFPLTQCKVFHDSITGLRWVSAAAGGFFLLVAAVPVWLCRERKYRRVAAQQPILSLRANLRGAFASRPFRWLLAAGFVQGFTYNIVSPLSFYLNVYLVYGGDLRRSAFAIGAVGSCYYVAGLVGSVALFPWLGRHWEKRRIYQFACGILALGCLSKFWLYQPAYPWFQLIVVGANGLSASGINLLAVAMLGDIVDDDERVSAARREGVFGSVMTWLSKAAMSLGGCLAGFFLVEAGFRAESGAQNATTLEVLKVGYAVVPLVGAVVAALLIERYPLDSSSVRRIQAELGARRTS